MYHVVRNGRSRSKVTTSSARGTSSSGGSRGGSGRGGGLDENVSDDERRTRKRTRRKKSMTLSDEESDEKRSRRKKTRGDGRLVTLAFTYKEKDDDYHYTDRDHLSDRDDRSESSELSAESKNVAKDLRMRPSGLKKRRKMLNILMNKYGVTEERRKRREMMKTKDTKDRNELKETLMKERKKKKKTTHRPLVGISDSGGGGSSDVVDSSVSIGSSVDGGSPSRRRIRGDDRTPPSSPRRRRRRRDDRTPPSSSPSRRRRRRDERTPTSSPSSPPPTFRSPHTPSPDSKMRRAKSIIVQRQRHAKRRRSIVGDFSEADDRDVRMSLGAAFNEETVHVASGSESDESSGVASDMSTGSQSFFTSGDSDGSFHGDVYQHLHELRDRYVNADNEILRSGRRKLALLNVQGIYAAYVSVLKCCAIDFSFAFSPAFLFDCRTYSFETDRKDRLAYYKTLLSTLRPGDDRFIVANRPVCASCLCALFGLSVRSKCVMFCYCTVLSYVYM